MPQRRLTREMPALSMRATFSPDSIDEEKRTVEVVWTTGERVLRGSWDKYYEELSLAPKHVRMDRLRSGAPLLSAHNSADLAAILGVVESAKLEKERGGVARVRFARAEDDPAADAIFRKVKDGVIRNVSVGYRIHRLEKIEEAEDQVPVFRATDWEPYEISLVPIGADAGAGVRSDTAEKNVCEFVVDDDEERHMPKKDPQGGAPAAPVAAVAEEQSGEVRAADSADATRAAVAADRERTAEIIRLGARMSLPQELVDEHVRTGTTLDAFRAIAIDARYERAEVNGPRDASPPSVAAGEDSRDKWIRGASAWLFQRAGIADMIAEAAKKRGDKVDLDPVGFRGMTFADLARQSLERAGVRTVNMSRWDILGRALTLREGGMHTTSDFPILLEAVTHKTLAAAYAVTPDTWTLFSAIGSVSDFRPHYRYTMGALGRLDVVNEHGEFKNKSLADGAAEPISAETRGNIIGITRQALINDDMGIFSRVATMLGRAARLSIEMDVYDLLKSNAGLGPTMSDGLTLFHADHDNLGTSSAISVAGVEADRMTMALQTDASGNEILDIRPRVLVVPIGIEATARLINDAQYDMTASAVPMTPNISRGLFTTVVGSPRLTGTRRYLFADPAVVPTFEVVFLDGNQTPYLETKEGWRIDGVEWKVRHDYGVGAVDYRGAVTNAGT
jgi:HK97 family phage prohead protease